MSLPADQFPSVDVSNFLLSVVGPSGATVSEQEATARQEAAEHCGSAGRGATGAPGLHRLHTD